MRSHTSPRIRRSAFFRALMVGLGVTWPVMSILLSLQAVLGAAVGMIEGWGAWTGVYFACVTGLTVGYGDLTPSSTLTRFMAMIIGVLGVVTSGVVVALAVAALQRAMTRRDGEPGSAVPGQRVPGVMPTSPPGAADRQG